MKVHDRIRECKWLPAALVLLCLFFFGIGFLTWSVYCLIVLLVLMPAGLCLKAADAFLASSTCALIILFSEIRIIHVLWPLPVAMALTVVFVAGRRFKFTRDGFDWIGRGNWGADRQSSLLSLGQYRE